MTTDFGKDLSNFIKELEKAENNVEKIGLKMFRMTGVVLYENILEFSPEWSRQFKASVNVTLNAVDDTFAPPVTGINWPSPVPASAKPKVLGVRGVRAVVNSATLDDVIIESNNAPHARVVEIGSPNRAPTSTFALAIQKTDIEIQKFANTFMPINLSDLIIDGEV